MLRTEFISFHLQKQGRGGKASLGLPCFRAAGPRVGLKFGPLPLWTSRVPLQPLDDTQQHDLLDVNSESVILILDDESIGV